MNPEKDVRGLIVSAPSLSRDAEDPVARTRAIGVDWYFYRVDFDSASSRLAAVSIEP